jgi:hypothetical protein
MCGLLASATRLFFHLQPELDQAAFLQDTLSLAYGQHGPFSIS